MNPKLIAAAWPFVKKAWKWTPSPLRLPLAGAAAAVAVWYVATGRHHDEQSLGPTVETS